MSDLKPCPFCGGEAVACNFTLEGAVDCKTCRASIVRRHQCAHDTGYAEAIAAWNARTVDPAAIREAALREAAKALNEEGLHVAAETIIALIDKGAG